jgi:hypothetical protein
MAERMLVASGLAQMSSNVKDGRRGAAWSIFLWQREVRRFDFEA